MDALLQHLCGQQEAMVELLRQLVEIESPSTDKAAVDRLGAFLSRQIELSGGRSRIHRSRSTGDHLQADFFAPRIRSRSPRPILLLGHLDTVWESGTLGRMPFRVTRGRAYGPGIYDMKAGIVIGLFALRALRQMALPVPGGVTFLLNADEEIGSPSSKPLTESLARRCRSALVLEPSYGPQGALKTARKGTGEYRLKVHGRAAHAGLDPDKGASAITELSKQLVNIEHLADKERGVTLNPGVICGGTRGNVVAAEAEAVIDVRIARLSDAKRVDRQLHGLRPRDRRTRLELSGGMNRPPFEYTAGGRRLFELAARTARPLGIELTHAAVGGGSDGNFTSALGLPTLDGLGGVGDGAHAAHEHVVVAELPRRAALLAHLIARLAAQELQRRA